jgi:ribonuclease T2
MFSCHHTLLCVFLCTIFVDVMCQLTLQPSAQQQIYVYAYSWTPGFCHGQKYPGCTDPLPYWTTNFTIHGLWPQYATNGYPSTCTSEPFDASIPQQIGENKMIQYWPDVKYDVTSASYNSFWQHEWTKHGTCSGLSQLDYFSQALDLTNRIPTPSVLYDSIGKNVSANAVRIGFGGANYVALQCTNQILTGAYTCWEQINSIPAAQIECPLSVMKEDTCMKTDDIIVFSLHPL